MADRLNDTDPQSPSAIQSRTDPGLGSPPPIIIGRARPDVEDLPLPPTPVPGSASIEELLDGITGPRPPPSSRRDAAQAARVYSAARPAPVSHPTPPPEPAVFSPEPPIVNERDALTVPRAPLDPGSVRPFVRRGEERTVYTGRRAIVRNSVAVILSAVAVTAMMMGIMRWKEAHRRPMAALPPAVEAPLPPPASPEVAPAAPAPTIVIVSPPPAPVDTSAAALAPVAASALPVAAPLAPMAPKRALGAKRLKTVPSGGSLDDLNREISH